MKCMGMERGIYSGLMGVGEYGRSSRARLG